MTANLHGPSQRYHGKAKTVLLPVGVLKKQHGLGLAWNGTPQPLSHIYTKI